MKEFTFRAVVENEGQEVITLALPIRSDEARSVVEQLAAWEEVAPTGRRVTAHFANKTYRPRMFLELMKDYKAFGW